MLEDMEAGRPLELEYLSGAIVRFGKALGVPTPVHEAAYRSISSVEPADRSNVWLGPLNDTRADPSRKDTGGLFRSERTVEEGTHRIGNASREPLLPKDDICQSSKRLRQ